MKKFMILLLAIGMLFSFAACDNSNSNAPSGDDEQVGTDTRDYAYVAAQNVPAKMLTFTNSTDGKFKATASLMAAGKWTTDYSGDLAANSFTYTTRTKGVNGLADEYTIITVSGRDITDETTSKNGTAKTVLLDRYTVEFSYNDSEALKEGIMEPVTGKLSGDMIGLVNVTDLVDGDIDDSTAIAVAVAGTDYLTTAASDVIAFLPDEADDVELSYLGNAVTASDFVAYVNYKGPKTGNLVSADAYYDAAVETYSGNVYSSFTGIVSAASKAGGILDIIATPGEFTATYEYINGTDDSSAVLTITNPTSKAVKFAQITDGVQYVLDKGATITITFEGERLTDSTFTAERYTIDGNLLTFKTNAAELNSDNVYADYASIAVKGFAGNLEGFTFTQSGTNAAGKPDTTLPSGFKFTKTVTSAEEMDVTGGTIETTVTAMVGPSFDSATAGEDTTYAQLGEIVVDCAEEAK